MGSSSVGSSKNYTRSISLPAPAHTSSRPIPIRPSCLEAQHHEWGFFSCCSVLLRAILHHIRTSGTIPVCIDIENTFSEYKPHAHADMSAWFNRPENAIVKVFAMQKQKTSTDITQHFDELDRYTFDPSAFRDVVWTYFAPNPSIAALGEQLEKKYQIVPSDSTFMYYRGTDSKGTDRSETPVDIFLKKCRDVHNNRTVIVQSDEPSVVDIIQREFPNVIHINELSARGGSPDESYRHSQVLLASCIIASKCDRIVMTTGNVSMWMILYRGNTANVHQYHHPLGEEKGVFLDL